MGNKKRAALWVLAGLLAALSLYLSPATRYLAGDSPSCPSCGVVPHPTPPAEIGIVYAATPAPSPGIAPVPPTYDASDSVPSNIAGMATAVLCAGFAAAAVILAILIFNPRRNSRRKP